MNPIERSGNLLLNANLDLEDAMGELKASGEISFETYESFGEDLSMLDDVAQKLRTIIEIARTDGNSLLVDAIEDRASSVLNMKQKLEIFIDDVTPFVRITDLCGALESIEAADSVPELERMFCN